MTHFPVQYKPILNFTDQPVVFEYPNIITKELANDIINIAKNYDGWHRRGSKEEVIDASFTTTLIHDLEHPIYEILDNLWKQFVDEHQLDIEFVEYYEVKEYLVGDKFNVHIDSHNRISETLDRKMNVIVQLSEPDSYEGGDLVVLRDKTSRELGTAIFFPAQYPHSVSEIISGVRYSLIGHAWGKVNRK